ncbi:helix-turn-helix domain-containing protein [Paracnuella aquatica]|uniref:helix-turn-helix domain-containing protein n=1 Tax=Paracnuella aquatica TaxID=2268757 RepID=UPI000DEECE72|nr:helix-turn-helix transcriptional regulator [Paracnuella aquatica]RPD43493.1 XRE family transcriptional regulator [Paracnuella aquatica]
MEEVTTTAKRNPHLGQNIERIRELRGIKQDHLAKALGVSQQAVSRMEKSAEVDDERLQKVAEVLGVSIEAIRNFNEEALFNNINSIHNNHDNSVNTFHVVNYQFNPVEKIVELYEQLLQSEREKVELYKTLLEQKR